MVIAYAELLARNIRVARAAAEPKLSQADVATRMRALGFGWAHQTVGQVERLARRLTAEEVLGLTVALETDVTAIVYPPAEGQPVRLPSGFEVGLPAAKAHWQPGRISVWKGNRLR